MLQSLGEAPVVSLGDTEAGPLTHANNLEGGDLALYAFTVPSGTLALEARLADRQGNPVLALRPGDEITYHYEFYSFNLLGYYGVEGGYNPASLAIPWRSPFPIRSLVLTVWRLKRGARMTNTPFRTPLTRFRCAACPSRN